MDLTCALFVIALIFIVTYWFLTRTFDYWKKQNVPSLPNPLPGFGHMWPIISLKQNPTIFTLDIYKKSRTSMVGFYFMRKPGLILCDPKLIKNVMVKNFSSFRNRGLALSEKSDPILSKNAFFADDNYGWKESKARALKHLSNQNRELLFDSSKDVTTKLDHYVDRKIKECNGLYECELKELFSRYTAELVVTCSFGIEGDSFEDKQNPLSFVNVAKEIFEPTTINGIRQAMLFYLPDIAKLLNIPFMTKKLDTYFREKLQAIIKQRRQANLVPNDFLQFCLESSSDEDLDTLIADILVFYVDVFETVSSVLAGLIFNLSQNQEVQDKLRAYILSEIKTNNNEITHDFLNNMSYLDQVIFESLRLNPSIGALSRICTSEITLTGSDGLHCRVQPGTVIMIPMEGLQTDEKYWENPHIFDPERFNSENKKKHHEGTYLPSGDGPRMCAGRPLALTLLRLATVVLLSKYKIKNSTKTKTPLEIDPSVIVTYAIGGLWAKFERCK